MKLILVLPFLCWISCCFARNLQVEICNAPPGPMADGPAGEERIQLGDPFGASPFAVALVYWQGDKYMGSFCTASLIAPDRVLTAAHCFEGFTPTVIAKVVVGLSDLREPSIEANKNNPNVSMIPFVFPTDVKNHKDYKGQSDWYENDISIIQLSQPVTAANAKPAKLARKEYLTNIQDLGWGRKDCANASIETLRRADGYIQPQNICEDYWRDFRNGVAFHHSQMCAFFTARTTGPAAVSFGDSGGPLFSNGPEGIIQVGVLSHVLYKAENYHELGWRCTNPEVPQVFTRVSSFEAWIKKRAPQAQFV